MTRRWEQRPDGSTWGDWGDEDQLGRLNLLGPDTVLAGVAEVKAGISFCLSLPLDIPGGTRFMARREAPVLFPTEDEQGVPANFFNIRYSARDPQYTDVFSDDMATMALQYSTQWDALAHVGSEFDATGDGVEEAMYYNGFRAGSDIVGPAQDASGDGRTHRCYARRLGIENIAAQGVQGRGVLIDLAHHFGDRNESVDYAALAGVMEADGVTVEPGDIVLLHTGWATALLAMGQEPDPSIHRTCAVLDGRDQRLLDWITDSGIVALASDNSGVEGVRRDDRHDGRAPLLPLHHHCLFKLGVPLGEMWYLHELAGWLREHGRSRFLLTAPPLRLPGAVGSPVTPIATV
jgi:kynurenine formamidase